MFSLIVSALIATDAQPNLVSIPDGVKERKAGTYEIVVTIAEFSHAKDDGVRATLYIPRTVSADALATRPLVVFFHGATKNKNLYRRVPYIFRRAEKDRFVLLSVQNWWSLSGGHLAGADESRWAANVIVHRLIPLRLFRADAVHAVGFSAGWLTAMATVLNSLDEPAYRERFSGDGAKDKEKYVCAYAGFGSFKGNFYPAAMSVPPMPDEKTSLQTHYQKLFAGKLAFMTVGGRKDAKRVQTQAPEARAFLADQLGLPVVYREFPKEGHAVGDSNWKPFWEAVEARLK